MRSLAPSSHPAERRQFVRARARALAAISIDGPSGDRFMAKVTNISRSGVLFECEHPPELGTTFRAHIGFRDGRLLRTRAEVVRVGAGGFGCRFTYVGPHSMRELVHFLRPREEGRVRSRSWTSPFGMKI